MLASIVLLATIGQVDRPARVIVSTVAPARAARRPRVNWELTTHAADPPGEKPFASDQAAAADPPPIVLEPVQAAPHAPPLPSKSIPLATPQAAVQAAPQAAVSYAVPVYQAPALPAAGSWIGESQVMSVTYGQSSRGHRPRFRPRGGGLFGRRGRMAGTSYEYGFSSYGTTYGTVCGPGGCN